MTDKTHMGEERDSLAQRLRAACASVRTKSYSLSDLLIPLMQQAADALTATHAQPVAQQGAVYAELPQGWPARFRCDSCDGNGEFGEPISMGHFQPPERARCPDCDGRGWCSEEAAFSADHMHAFADATHALRTQQPAPGGATPAEAVERIVHLRADRERRIYVAGPMTGLPEYNFPLFNATAARLRSEGWHVENPAEHGHVEGATWADYLRYDLSRVVTCGAMYLLPGWSKSKGAGLEVHVAGVLGLQVILADGAEPVAKLAPAQDRLADVMQGLANAAHKVGWGLPSAPGQKEGA